MRTRIVFLIIVAAGALVLSCGDSTPTGGDGTRYTFADFVHFDTSAYLLVKSLPGPNSSSLEPFLGWEESFGEPFTDVNGNGVYDEGIDGFIKCVCPENQDLNHNGRHDGPDDLWDQYIPFDDINGDDSCQQSHFGLYHRNYQEGVPFVDINGNQVYDSALEYVPTVVKCHAWTDTAGETSFYYRAQDSIYTFVSDSGITYVMPPFFYDPDNLFSGNLWTNDSGLDFSSYDCAVHILDTGQVFPVEGQEVVLYCSLYVAGPFTFEKSILLGQRLDVWDVHYEDLLLVKYVYPTGTLHGESTTPPFYYFEFYFSRGYGLIGIFYRTAYKYEFFCFDHRFDSFPLPMTR